MKANFWFFVGIIIVAIAINVIMYLIISALQRESSGLAFLFRIVSYAISTIINIGLITIALEFINNKKPEFEDLFTSFKGCFWRYLWTSLLVGLIVAGGLLLFIVPGIYWAVKFQFCTYLIIDQNCRVTESLKRSSKITEGVRWNLLGFGLLLVLINIAGAIVFLIGLLVTIPLTMIAYASVYRKLQYQTEVFQSSETTVSQ